MKERRVLLVSLAALALGLWQAWPARSRVLCQGFLPKNDMKIPVGDVAARGIDEAAFNKVLDAAEKFYKPVIAARGATLVVNRLWSDPTVNASAEQIGQDWHINMYGGLARHGAVTSDGFALVVCHEIGHHIGGFPRIGGSWATNEGGSDYFSTLKCLRSILGTGAASKVDPVAKSGCGRAFPKGANRNLCEKGAMAGVSVSGLLAELGGDPEPGLATPDSAVVDETNDEHPAAQCRLDTYYQAALCVKPVSESLSDVAAAPGACTTAEGYKEGVRPLCWFKPSAEELPPQPAAKLSLESEQALEQRVEALARALSGGGI